ncbi:hypothetical protein AgCh_001664 [Apium graveolens]
MEKRKEKKNKKEKKDKKEKKEKQGLPECSNVDNHGSGCTQSDETSDLKFLVVDNKLNNTVLSSRSASKNGKTLETLKASSLLAFECARSSSKVDDKLELAHPVLENKVVQKAATLTARGGHEEIGHSKVDNKEHKLIAL